jgi:ABC-type oligopeptide transport system substrate-binding subunit
MIAFPARGGYLGDMRRFLILSALLLLLAAPAPAQESGPAPGLAMHGAPKYAPGFAHLDYVNPAAPKGGTLRQAALGTFDTVNPFSLKGVPAEGLSLVYDRLMARVWDEPFTLYPLIAERADVPEDRGSITFHLDPRARFSDGSAITADDILFSFETMRASGRPNMQRVYKLVDKAEKLDARTIRFTLSPAHDRETVMILAMMPVLSKAWWSGRTFDMTTLDIPVSSGPYKIAEIDPGHRIVLARDPDYWAKDLPVNRGQYNFGRMVFDYYRDDTVALEAFKAGATDLRREYDIGKWMRSYDFPALSRGGVVKEQIAHSRPEKVKSFIFNTRRAPFNDRRVREALNYVLDYDWINQNLFFGQYRRITSYFPNSYLAASGLPDAEELELLAPYKNELPPETFGPAWTPPPDATQADLRANLLKADALLKEAGWIVKDGRRVSAKTGKPFSFEILLSDVGDEKIALAFIRSLRRLGIAAQVRLMDAAAFRGRLNSFDFDIVLYYWINTLSPGSEQMLYWSCEAAKQQGRFNYAGICNPAIDALARRIAAVRTKEELIDSVHALDRALMWGFYIVPLHYLGADDVAYRRFVGHPARAPIYGMVLESWWAQPSKEGK